MENIGDDSRNSRITQRLKTLKQADWLCPDTDSRSKQQRRQQAIIEADKPGQSCAPCQRGKSHDDFFSILLE